MLANFLGVLPILSFRCLTYIEFLAQCVCAISVPGLGVI
jgi:hypothetical protein